jgi:hypothetical protein
VAEEERMTEQLTEQQLAELEALADAATPGPWDSHDEMGPSTVVFVVGVKHCAVINALYAWWEGIGEKEAISNAAFVAASRAAVPALIAEVRRLNDLLSPKP